MNESEFPKALSILDKWIVILKLAIILRASAQLLPTGEFIIPTPAHVLRALGFILPARACVLRIAAFVLRTTGYNELKVGETLPNGEDNVRKREDDELKRAENVRVGAWNVIWKSDIWAGERDCPVFCGFLINIYCQFGLLAGSSWPASSR